MKTKKMGTMILNSFDNLLTSENSAAINEMIYLKETALADAIENVEFLTKRQMLEHAENEKARVQLLTRQIEKLKNALN